jgi:hypothetical protein
VSPVDVNELIKKAWDAVDKAGVPEPIQGVALKEAIDFLRGGSPPSPSPGGGGGNGSSRKKASRKSSKGESSAADIEIPDADKFFSKLAEESGVDKVELTDCLQLRPDGAVIVSTPTKDLGDTVTKQAKACIALVAGARARGLGENPVDGQAVRDELNRKNCYDSTNFSQYHLKPLKGFNAGGGKEIVLTSKWVKEFEDAVKQANGTATEE